MKRKSFLFPFFLIVIFLFSQCRLSAMEGKRGAVLDFLSSIDAGVVEEKFYLGKKLATLDYDINRIHLYIGNEKGTKFFFTETHSELKRDSSTRRYNAHIHMEERGVMLGTRFASLPGHSFAMGFSRRDAYYDRIYKYINQGDCTFSAYCEILEPGFVDSDPFYFDYYYDPPGSRWNTGFSYMLENVRLLGTGQARSVRTGIYTLKVGHEWEKVELNLSLSRLLPTESPKNINDLPNNSNIEFMATYKPRRHIKIHLTGGVYTDGLPTAGGAFSDIGENFVFQYLGAVDGFDTMYLEGFGYFSLGVTISLK